MFAGTRLLRKTRRVPSRSRLTRKGHARADSARRPRFDRRIVETRRVARVHRPDHQSAAMFCALTSLESRSSQYELTRYHVRTQTLVIQRVPVSGRIGEERKRDQWRVCGRIIGSSATLNGCRGRSTLRGNSPTKLLHGEVCTLSDGRVHRIREMDGQALSIGLVTSTHSYRRLTHEASIAEDVVCWRIRQRLIEWTSGHLPLHHSRVIALNWSGTVDLPAKMPRPRRVVPWSISVRLRWYGLAQRTTLATGSATPRFIVTVMTMPP